MAIKVRARLGLGLEIRVRVRVRLGLGSGLRPRRGFVDTFTIFDWSTFDSIFLFLANP